MRECALYHRLVIRLFVVSITFLTFFPIRLRRQRGKINKRDFAKTIGDLFGLLDSLKPISSAGWFDDIVLSNFSHFPIYILVADV